jgi:large subunit ribosomal protein L13
MPNPQVDCLFGRLRPYFSVRDQDHMKTFSPRPRDIERRWYVVDADGVVLGRLATHVASILRGKHKPIYAPHADTGDHVIVVNARGIQVTGGKEFEKIYYRHSGYPGGLRRIGYEGLLAERPALAVEKAIGGMLPKNRLGRQMLTKLSVYEGAEHPHQAQKPVALGHGEYPRWEGLPKPAPAPAGSKETKPSGRKATSGPKSRAQGVESGPSRPRRAARPKGAASRAATGAAKAAPATGRAAPKASTAKSAATASRAKAASTVAKTDKSAKASEEGEKPKRASRRAKKES